MKKIQFYYICLLVAFERCSSSANKRILTDPKVPEQVKENIGKRGKLCLYRGCHVSAQEINYFQENKHPLRVYNEFLSCYLDRDNAKRFAYNRLLELEVDYILDTENKLFIFLHEELSVFSEEREVLLKSGVIIHFLSFNQNFEQNGIKYILKGKVISFDQKEISKIFIKNFSGDKLSYSLLFSNLVNLLNKKILKR